MGYQVFSGDNVDAGAVPIDFYLASDTGEVVIVINNLEGKKHTAIVDGAAGVQQYSWNLQFDGAALDEAQIAFVEQQLVDMIEAWEPAGSTGERGRTEEAATRAELEERLAAYRAATDDPHRMKAIRGLGGVRVGPTGDGAARGARGGRGGRGGFGGRGGRGGFGAWGEPAGTGEFLITMSVGDTTQTTTLVVREDPIRQGR